MAEFGHFENGKYAQSIIEESLEQHDAAINSDRFVFSYLGRVKFEDLIEEVARRIVEKKGEGQIVGLTRVWGKVAMHIDIRVRLRKF